MKRPLRPQRIATDAFNVERRLPTSESMESTRNALRRRRIVSGASPRETRLISSILSRRGRRDPDASGEMIKNVFFLEIRLDASRDDDKAKSVGNLIPNDVPNREPINTVALNCRW